MKFNKTIALMVLVAGGLLASGGLQAQDTVPVKPATPPAGEAKPLPPGGGKRQAMTPEKTAKAIGLDEEQTTKFVATKQEQRQKVTDLRADTSLTMEEKRAKLKAITEATNTKLKGFMTAEQFEKYTKITPGPRNRPGAAAPGASAPMPTPVPALDKPATNIGK